MSEGLSRRDLFRRFTAKAKTVHAAATAPTPPPPPPPEATVAVIQGRYCLAYTTVCTVCSERCPVPGAMTVTAGIPMVVSDICTGCTICHDVCPAPRNAVLMIPRGNTPSRPNPHFQ